MAVPRILITGGTGFVGARVAEFLASDGPRADRPALRLLAHRSWPDALAGRAEMRTGSLTDPASLRGVCDGVDTVLHLASQVGGGPEECRAVNDAGTGALLAEAKRAGVRRIVQLGTTAVYRDGRHLGPGEGELEVGPTSATSVSRLAGEQRVLAAGGLVVRPHLVYGPGDVWVGPALAEFLTVLPHWVDGGRALMSVIGVEDLARVLAALAVRASVPRGAVLHAGRPAPVRARELITATARALDLPLPVGEVTYEQARGWHGAQGDPGWHRRLSLLAMDHWYDTSRLWRLLGIAPGGSFAADFAAGADWYRARLGTDPSVPVSGPTRTAARARSSA
ncbi:NAD(P)-dependent oxidoreductase [Streptomyces sp. G3]|uniref:NAD-dependent epimerase/dehydratase family protein n=1 Tax=unclassified Streptomyces TaxID=2593676 RepID=UPI0013C73CDC|nr:MULTISPECIES: NAD(P)-dependent oxidoreductase [unclassified Streptomyces]MCM1942123.1 NAD(P)-dependent oxidoreductase [Streptomyces sp. G3]NDZ76348.1 NAD(P)-dependent oxidoreductase [Streptomyces sp. SID10362]